MERTGDAPLCDSSLVELEAWIEAAHGGDTQALGRALSSCRDYLMLIASDRLRPELRAKGSASDLVQETFLRAQRRIGGFRGRTSSEWRNWLRKILLRNLSKHRRRFGTTAKRRVERETAMPEPSRLQGVATYDTASGTLARREREAALVEAVDRLPEQYRQVVVWHHREQLSFVEIGRRCEISAEAGRKLWKRALARLRKELGPAYDSR